MSWGYVAVAAATVISGAMSNSASNKAAKAANSKDAQAIAEQRRQFDLFQQNLGPYMQYGSGSLGGLSKLMAGDYSGFMDSPDFKARVGFANDQFNNGAAAKYRLFSGGAQNDRDELNQNLAAQGLGDYRNFLQWGANLGQNAAAGVGQAGMDSANQIGGYLQNQGQTSAYNAMNQGQNNANTIAGLGSLLGGYLGKSSYGSGGGSGGSGGGWGGGYRGDW